MSLPEDIVADGSEPTTTQPRRILLTGATGLLGSHLVRELLDRSTAQVWCLVRASSVEHGRERIDEAMRRYGTWRETDGDRIVAVVGDLGAEGLGLTADVRASLAADMDMIVHNGARVNHIETYTRMHRPNVASIEELLRIAVAGRLKPVHFVSTVSVLTDIEAREDPSAPIAGEDDRLAPERIPNSGYIQSKWVGEEVLRIARERGIPVSIYRPGLIAGDLVTGASGTDDAFWNMVRAIAGLGMIPDIAAQMSVPLVPVNYVAAALVGIALDPRSLGGNYHLVSPHRSSMVDLRSELAAAGFDLRDVDVAEFGGTLFRTAERLAAEGDDSLMRAMLVAGQFGAGAYEEKFTDTNTRSALEGTGIDCPPVDSVVLQRYVDYLVRIGFLRHVDPA